MIGLNLVYGALSMTKGVMDKVIEVKASVSILHKSDLSSNSKCSSATIIDTSISIKTGESINAIAEVLGFQQNKELSTRINISNRIITGDQKLANNLLEKKVLVCKEDESAKWVLTGDKLEKVKFIFEYEQNPGGS